MGCRKVMLEMQVGPDCSGLECHPEEFLHQKAFSSSLHMGD